MNITNQKSRSPASRVMVNGSNIKFIRESKGLTQLYVASVLGVTTDTISRWENGKYPTVKWENVERLAKALEVAVDELIAPVTESSPEVLIPSEPTANIQAKPDGSRRWYLTLFVGVIVGLAGVAFFSITGQKNAQITATRFLPQHITPGQPYPVVVRVESSDTQPFTFILEEKLPENFTVVRGLPELASFDSGSNTAKWIGNSRQQAFFVAYLVQSSSNLRLSGKMTFSGRIKADNAPRFEQSVLGDSEVALSNFHWADANRDGLIDDAEILAAFSSADMLKELGVDTDQIKKIWATGGYSWDQANKQYRVIQKNTGGG